MAALEGLAADGEAEAAALPDAAEPPEAAALLEAGVATLALAASPELALDTTSPPSTGSLVAPGSGAAVLEAGSALPLLMPWLSVRPFIATLVQICPYTPAAMTWASIDSHSLNVSSDGDRAG